MLTHSATTARCHVLILSGQIKNNFFCRWQHPQPPQRHPQTKAEHRVLQKKFSRQKMLNHHRPLKNCRAVRDTREKTVAAKSWWMQVVKLSSFKVRLTNIRYIEWMSEIETSQFQTVQKSGQLSVLISVKRLLYFCSIFANLPRGKMSNIIKNWDWLKTCKFSGSLPPLNPRNWEIFKIYMYCQTLKNFKIR